MSSYSLSSRSELWLVEMKATFVVKKRGAIENAMRGLVAPEPSRRGLCES